jgi:hypothetical protein
VTPTKIKTIGNYGHSLSISSISLSAHVIAFAIAANVAGTRGVRVEL